MSKVCGCGLTAAILLLAGCANQPAVQAGSSPAIASSSSAASAEAIKHVVTLALNLEFSIGAPTAEHRAAALGGAASRGSAVAQGPITADQIKSLRAAYLAQVNQLCSGQAADLLKQGLEGSLRSAKGHDFRDAGGGVRNVVFKSMSISGATASTSVTYDTYSLIAVHGVDGNWSVPDADPPGGKSIATLALVKSATGNWKITKNDWHFAPGYHP
jgi:hypothetical protein